MIETVVAGRAGYGVLSGLGAALRAVAMRSQALRRLPAVFLVAFLAAACSTTEAMQVPVPVSSSEKYAAIVIDANTREVLYAKNADAIRYPASLTKMMTVYFMFEAMDAGRMSLSTPITISANAARRQPSKLGFNPGETITAENAVKALIVKSANDVATAVAEHFGGTEDRFGQMMTAKARELGMVSTVFRNASGLPDSQQRSTARDMARLAVALRTRFPHYYHYFSLSEFVDRGKTITGHNAVLRTIAGADGLKTGYTRASGFNLATSVTRGGRRIVAVVMGETSAKVRNQHMEQLVARFLPQASRR